jgi:CRP-like cAMP-binding protein
MPMDEALLSKLVDAGSECEFDAGQVIIEPGQPGTGLYLIREGTVRVEAPERTVELGPGEIVGERALDAPHGVRSARVVCVTDVRALAVDRLAYEAATTR